ncbi:MAG: hypothetical protein QOC61_1926 [Acidobacteriota bacterium]|jgi:hypothetical protein|nr:hypothetical protein [Acidobacteriota bacterium]
MCGHDNIAARRGARAAVANIPLRRLGDLEGFDEEYERRLAEARERAGARGRGDVLEYLHLKAANDSLRSRGVEWLLDSLNHLAGELNREGAGLTLTRTEAHRFRVGHSTMVGTRLVLRRGLRALTVEAGWPRGPRDGVVRGGGLASALVGHFGDRRAGEELFLLPSDADDARWFIIEKNGARTELLEERLRRHLTRLLD